MTDMELRCKHKLFGILEDGKLEVKCDSRFCGAGPKVVVIHQFDLHTGAVETKRYKAPPLGRRGLDASDNVSPLRTA